MRMVDVEPRIGLVQAASSPRLLGATPLWRWQLEVLEAMEGPQRIFLLRVGRRGGKGYLDALVAAHNALCCEHLSMYLRPGERRHIVVVSRKGTQAALVLRFVEQIVASSPAFAGTIERASDDRLDFANGVSILAPANADGARGVPLSCLITVESAHFSGERGEAVEAGDRSMWNAWRALSPGTAQFNEHGLIIVESTPRGRSGFFYDICSRAEAGEIPEALEFHYTTAEANPTITPEFLAAEEARDPENFASEYEALWDDGAASAFIDFERFIPGPDVKLEPDTLAGPVVVGLDMAQSGLIGVAVVGRAVEDPRRLRVAHVDGLKVSRARTLLGLAQVQTTLLDRAVTVAKRYGAEVVVDQFASKQTTAHFRDAGLPCTAVTTTGPSKDAGYREVRDRLYSGGLEIPADPALMADLRRLRSRVTAAGSSSVVNPRVKGQHGDRASAVMLAVARQVELGAPRPPEGRPSGGPSGVTLAPGSEMPGLPVEPKSLQRDLLAPAGEGFAGPKLKWRPNMTTPEREQHQNEVEACVRRGRAMERRRRRRDPDGAGGGGVRLTDSF